MQQHTDSLLFAVEEFVLGFFSAWKANIPHGDEFEVAFVGVGGKRTTALGCLWWSDDEGKESRVCTLVLISLIH